MKIFRFLILTGLFILSAIRVHADKMMLGDILDDRVNLSKPKKKDPNDPQLKKRTYKPGSTDGHHAAHKTAAKTSKSTHKADVEKPKPAKTSKSTPSKKIVSEKTPAVSAEDQKKKADSVYLLALKAAQANDFNKAYDLCQQTLQINPRHLQAQKMAERLGSRHIP